MAVFCLYHHGKRANRLSGIPFDAAQTLLSIRNGPYDQKHHRNEIHQTENAEFTRTKKMKQKIFFMYFILMTMSGWAFADEMRVEKAVKEVELRGYTRSIKTATISSEVSGRIMKVSYEIGDTITREPLAAIDPTFIDFELKSTGIALSGVDTRLQKIQSRISYLAKEFQRKEQLFSKGRATEVIRDAALQELDQARLEEESIQQEGQTLNVRYHQLQEKKERHAVTAPAEWIVTQKMVEAGEIIQPGMPMAVVQDFRQLVVPLSVSNEEMQGIRRKGERFEAMLEGRPVQASIYYVNPEFNEQTRKIHIKLLIQDYPDAHRGGLRFVLPILAESDGLRIPSAALISRYENPKILIKGSKTAIPVTILDTAEQFVTISHDPRLSIGTILTDPKGRQN